MSPEIQNILEEIDLLNIQEKKDCSLITQEDFSSFIKKDIICVGCRGSLQKFMDKQLEYSKKQQDKIELEGIVVYPDGKIGIKPEYLKNNINIACYLQSRINDAGMSQEDNRCLGIKRQGDGFNLNSKKNYRKINQ
ncbi:hypothetical protein PPERSA_03545 [Pseudocohnilembus persalinus]|uniref:Uncharacterized protein n=1 Tax=Pseudocohnilembus persalinus TaxID=266149 RepID=A0A0V0QQ52_PSEPJ|nr:hypothetical protein PPERSA_03545 [Pseudocohnilembus persalinus]|eukprot:KRX04305.1 hypothetical protein PPERSA_03545 [Pseudocohnilembus persalinus]